MKRLENKDISLVHSMIPLVSTSPFTKAFKLLQFLSVSSVMVNCVLLQGSCTMKLNSSSELMVSHQSPTWSPDTHFQAYPEVVLGKFQAFPTHCSSPLLFSQSPGGSLPTSTPSCRWIRRMATRFSSDSWRRTSVKWRATTGSPSSQTGQTLFYVAACICFYWKLIKH